MLCAHQSTLDLMSEDAGKRTDYGSRLDEAMADAKMTRAALARRLGITPQAVGLVLSGNSKAFDAVNHSMACEALNVRPVWLATGKGPMRATGWTPTVVAAEEPTPRPYSLQEVVEQLAVLLKPHEEMVRNAISPMLAELARQPDEGRSIAAMIAAVIATRTKRAG